MKNSISGLKINKLLSGYLALVLMLFSFSACSQPDRLTSSNEVQFSGTTTNLEDRVPGLDTAIFAGGCFWCTEALFQQIVGVDTVISGFTGGHIKNPTYQQVIRGNTGHAEAILVIYDSLQLTYDDLLEAFFTAHDPTQLNRQGHDVGTQYRSAIFYRNEQQYDKASYYIDKLNKQLIFGKPVVTALESFTDFFVAEDYHQNYFQNNPDQAYCQYVIVPKLETFKRLFLDRRKEMESQSKKF